MKFHLPSASRKRFCECTPAGRISASAYLWGQSNTYIPQLTSFLVPLGQTLRKQVQFNVYMTFFFSETEDKVIRQMILQVVPMRESETSEGFIYAGSSAALAGKL